MIWQRTYPRDVDRGTKGIHTPDWDVHWHRSVGGCRRRLMKSAVLGHYVLLSVQLRGQLSDARFGLVGTHLLPHAPRETLTGLVPE